MQYNEKVIEHFRNPHNQGRLDDADAIGEAGNPVCGDVMKIYLKIGSRQRAADSKNEYYIKDIKFETLGCAAAIAVSSSLTDIAKGKTLEEALAIKKDDIVNELGGLPDLKVHCSMLGLEALHKAINNYKSR